MTIKELLGVLPARVPVEIVLDSADNENDEFNIKYDRDNVLHQDAFADYVIDHITPTPDDFNDGHGEGILIYIKTQVKPVKHIEK